MQDIKIFALILSVMGFYFNLDINKDNSCLTCFPLFLVIIDVSSDQDTWYFLPCDSCSVVWVTGASLEGFVR